MRHIATDHWHHSLTFGQNFDLLLWFWIETGTSGRPPTSFPIHFSARGFVQRNLRSLALCGECEQFQYVSYVLARGLSLAYAAVAQPLHRGIRCRVEGSETTFELVYQAAVNDVRNGLGGSTEAQWVVSVTPLLETGCTSASA